MIFATGLLTGLLVASVIVNIAVTLDRRRQVRAALQHEQRLLDRAAAAEIRSAEQIDAMLDRIRTAPRLELQASAPATVGLAERAYIPDTPDGDEEWNDYRGANEADE